MKGTGPYKIKQIGSRIKNYQKEKWQSAAKQIAKFFQNKSILIMLKAAGDMRMGWSIKRSVLGGRKSLERHWLSSSLMLVHSGGLMAEVLVAVRAKLFQKPN